MEYLNIVTNEYPLSELDIKKNFPNTSFPSDVSGFNNSIFILGYVAVNPTQKPLVDYTKNISKGSPKQTENGYEQTWIISDASEEEIAKRTSEKSLEIKETRNLLLAESDWTQLPDSHVNSSLWATYRQELRDISKQLEFPWNVIWPTKP